MIPNNILINDKVEFTGIFLFAIPIVAIVIYAIIFSFGMRKKHNESCAFRLIIISNIIFLGDLYILIKSVVDDATYLTLNFSAATANILIDSVIAHINQFARIIPITLLSLIGAIYLAKKNGVTR